jgi:hypothetical protein
MVVGWQKPAVAGSKTLAIRDRSPGRWNFCPMRRGGRLYPLLADTAAVRALPQNHSADLLPHMAKFSSRKAQYPCAGAAGGNHQDRTWSDPREQNSAAFGRNARSVTAANWLWLTYVRSPQSVYAPFGGGRSTGAVRAGQPRSH